MTVREESKVIESYAQEDALFTRTLLIDTEQPPPGVWHRTARRAVLQRVKKALPNLAMASPTQRNPSVQYTDLNVQAIVRWLI